jgi:hypothetical protein
MHPSYLFSHNTLRVSDGLSIHHQELASRLPYLFDIYLLLYVQSWTPDDGRKDRPKHVQCYAKINKFEKLVHLVGFTVGIKKNPSSSQAFQMICMIWFERRSVNVILRQYDLQSNS